MSTLVVIDYENEVKAEEVRLALLKMQKEYLIDLEDAVVVVRDQKGKVKLRQLHNLTAAGAASGGFWGALMGLIFLNPLFGFAIGAAARAIAPCPTKKALGVVLEQHSHEEIVVPPGLLSLAGDTDLFPGLGPLEQG
jgi:uncharacterized membrane protein